MLFAYCGMVFENVSTKLLVGSSIEVRVKPCMKWSDIDQSVK